MRLRLVWKLSAVVVAILIAAVAFAGYVSNLICAHYSLETGRAFLQFNSETIINSIGQMMMIRNNEGIEQFLADMSRDSRVFGDIRVVSHHSGEIVASRFGTRGDPMAINEWACSTCHTPDEPTTTETRIFDSVTRDPAGGRLLAVMTPIINEPGCRNAACHAHADSPEILGFLHADYSLSSVDATVTERRRLIFSAVLVSLLLGIAALWLTFSRLLESPIHALIEGTKRVAAGQLDHRFDATRNDEIGVLEESFNTMTERIRAHRGELRTTMEYLGAIVENSADIIITVTTDGIIETFNRGAEEALGFGRSELIGKHIDTLYVDPRERDVAVARLRETGTVKNYETAFRTSDGGVRHVLLSLSYLRDRQGNPIGTFGISKDITLEKELMRDLMQSQKFAAIGQAVTGIQHAIKNMLHALKGGAYLIRTGMSKNRREQIEEGEAMIQDGIERIGGLARNMLSYAREWRPELQHTDLNKLLEEIHEEFRQAATEQGIRLHIDPGGDIPTVTCDPKLIHMALSDIVVNAIDACAWKEYPTSEQPEVALKSLSDEQSGRIVIEVRDNGCGMNEEVRSHIFTPFFSTKKALGTGFGLAVTDRIIKVHDGEIQVESVPDRGSVFQIHLPVTGPATS